MAKPNCKHIRSLMMPILKQETKKTSLCEEIIKVDMKWAKRYPGNIRIK